MSKDGGTEEESKELSRMQGDATFEQAKEAAARTRHLEEELLAAQEGEAKAVSEVASSRAATQHQIARKNIWAMWVQI